MTTYLHTTNYLYDGANVIEEVDATGTVLARYSQGPGIDQPLDVFTSGATKYYDADGLGSITSLADISGSLTDTYTTDSFGKSTASSGTTRNPFRYTAREFDSETGLYYYRARYYDFTIGRFTTEDTLRFGAGHNFFSYATNRPTGFIDPSGNLSIATGFSPQCIADILAAVQILRDRARAIPECNLWFCRNGLRLSLTLLLDNPAFTLRYDPLSETTEEGGRVLGYVQHGEPFNIYLKPDACSSGPTHIAQDIVHEFGHLTLGHFSPKTKLKEREHNKVRLLENTCGFPIQFGGTSVTVTP